MQGWGSGEEVDRGFSQGDREAPETLGGNGASGARKEEFQRVQCVNSKLAKARLLSWCVH